VKNVILLVSILCVGYFAFPKNIVAADANSPAEVNDIKKPGKTADANSPADVNDIKKPGKTADANSINAPVKAADSNEAADVNAVEDSNRILGELKNDLAGIDRDGQKEIKEWTREGGERGTATTASAVLENKIELAKSARDQVIKELNFLKTVAVGEGAKKTATAIEALLADRKVRFEKMIAQMKKEASRLKEKEKSQIRTPRTREGSITPDRSYDSTSMEEKRKKREEAIKKREERMKKTQTQDANSQQNASEDN
jgi:hypothetical protein